MSFNFPENEIKQVKIFSKLHDNSPVTVVFIHGFASNHVGFNRMGEILDQHKISYFTFDLPGHGETPVIEHTKMHINYFTKIVEDIIKYYKLKKIKVFHTKYYYNIVVYILYIEIYPSF